MAKYKNEILRLLRQGVPNKEIAKQLGCTIHAVNRYYYTEGFCKKRPSKYNEKGERRCYRCGRYLSLDNYCKDKYSKDGLQNMCRECNSRNAKQKRFVQKWYNRTIVVHEMPEPENIDINIYLE